MDLLHHGLHDFRSGFRVGSTNDLLGEALNETTQYNLISLKNLEKFFRKISAIT